MRQLITHGARIFPEREEYQRFLKTSRSSAISKHLQVLKDAEAEQEDSQGIQPLDCQAIWPKHRELKHARNWGDDNDSDREGAESPDELKWFQDDNATVATTMVGVDGEDAHPTKSEVP